MMTPENFNHDRFMVCHNWNLDLEGRRFSNHDNDWGGPTNCGVTQTTFSEWLNRNGMPDRTVSEIRHYEVETIYRDFYYLAARCQDTIVPFDFVLFQWAVNRGPYRAIKTLQMATAYLGTYKGNIDGSFGPKTMSAFQATEQDDLTRAFLTHQAFRYLRIINKSEFKRKDFLIQKKSLVGFKDQREFGPGWLNRVREVARMIKFDYELPVTIVEEIDKHHTEWKKVA